MKLPKQKSLKEVLTAPLSICVQVKEKNNQPCIELRKVITDFNVIKNIISCTYHRIPVIILPEFTNALKSISTLVEKGIIYKGEDNNFYYTF